MLATIPMTQKYESKRWLRVPQPLADAQQFRFHTSLWCVSGSEETILVFEASELIESETSRVSCFAWKSQNLKDTPKERVAQHAPVKLSLICRKPPPTDLFSSLPPPRAEQQVQWTEKKSNPAIQHAIYKDTQLPRTLSAWNPHSLLESSGSWRREGSVTFQDHCNRARASLQAVLSHNPVPLTILRFQDAIPHLSRNTISKWRASNDWKT